MYAIYAYIDPKNPPKCRHIWQTWSVWELMKCSTSDVCHNPLSGSEYEYACHPPDRALLRNTAPNSKQELGRLKRGNPNISRPSMGLAYSPTSWSEWFFEKGSAKRSEPVHRNGLWKTSRDEPRSRTAHQPRSPFAHGFLLRAAEPRSGTAQRNRAGDEVTMGREKGGRSGEDEVMKEDEDLGRALNNSTNQARSLPPTS